MLENLDLSEVFKKIDTQEIWDLFIRSLRAKNKDAVKMIGVNPLQANLNAVDFTRGMAYAIKRLEDGMPIEQLKTLTLNFLYQSAFPEALSPYKIEGEDNG
jgi:hypothetical protein